VKKEEIPVNDKTIAAALGLLALLGCSGATAQAPAEESATETALMTEEQKTFYTLGTLLGNSVGALNPDELAAVQKGLADKCTDRTLLVDVETYRPKVGEMMKARAQAKTAEMVAQSAAFLEKAAQEPGAERLDSGLIYTEITAGEGASPGPKDKVTVHYRGTLTDGSEFDSSYSRNEPAVFALNGVIPCWTEGLQKVKLGGKSKLICPASIAYGERGRPGIPGGAALVFEVELIKIEKAS
jgi:FKBP-type peptidyl-prolyl cis-trans isomerase FkpA